MAFAAEFAQFHASADCTLTNTGRLPFPETGLRSYQGYPTGLYPNYANDRPPAHLAAGLSIAVNEIKPVNDAGNVDTNNGKIVLLSIGMSNTTQEWASKGTEHFRALANADPAKNPRVTATDTNGNTALGSVVVTVNTTFDDWRTNKFTEVELPNPALNGGSANPNFDLFPNLLEYVMGLEPKTANPADVVSATASNGVFRLSYPHFKFSADTALDAEVSLGLSHWNPASVSQVIDLGQIETVIVAEPISGSEARYYRLRAIR